MAVLVIKKGTGGRILENRVLRIVNDPAVTPERPKRAAQTRGDPGTKNVERRTIEHGLTGVAQLGAPGSPDRVFRVASHHDECAAPGA